MKQTAVTLFFFQLVCLLSAQNLNHRQYNQKRLNTNKKAMLVLSGWAVGNLAVGSVLISQREGRSKYFHQMNTGWGAINLGLATIGYLSATRADPASFDTFQTVSEQYKIQKILLLNAGLDLAYMAGGAFLLERSKNVQQKPERLRGFGESIILQGAFLFAFDVGVYMVHRSHNKSLQLLLDGLTFHGNGVGWRMVF